MRSVPPADFAREAAALSPSKSFSNLRTESRVQSVNRQIAIRGSRKRPILPAPRLWAVAMRLSSRQGSIAAVSGCCTTGSVFGKVFFWSWHVRRGELTQKQFFDPGLRNEKTAKSEAPYRAVDLP